MVYCEICKKKFKNVRALTQHIIHNHNINSREYYNLYMKKKHEDICNHENCNNITTYYNLRKGYAHYCSLQCANTSSVRKEEERKRTLKRMKDPKERIKLSKTVKKAYRDHPEYKEKVSIGVRKAFKNDPTIRERATESIKNFYINNPEERKKAGERNKKIWENPETRKKMLEKQRKIWKSEDYREKKRIIANEVKTRKDWYKNVSEGTIAGWNKVPEKKEKQREYMKNGGAAHCNRFIKNPSKPQVALFKLCQEILPYPIMNYPCLGYSIDIAVPKLNLAIEYDGSYWHQDKEYDETRQKRLEEEGWSFIKFVDRVPTKSELMEVIHEENYR